MILPAGTRLGPYAILGPLGAGGMGVVYRANDTRLGRDVAVKVLPAAYAADHERLHRFELEAQAAGRLNHPNILAVFDIGTHDGAPYLVTELLEGQTLRERLGDTALAVRRAVEYAMPIAHGLAAAHDKGIVHRDLKPENLFLTRDGRLKILDFGLAKLLPPAVGGALARDAPTITVDTDPGTVMGTVNYMSPEQVRAQAVDHRTDIFSLGVILYEMLAGTRAFRRDSAVETMNAILKEEPPELSTVNPAVPPALERVVRHCLEKSPEERFQSARDLAFDLEALSAASGSGPTPRGGGRPRARMLRSFAWLSAGMTAVALASFYLGRGTGGSPPPRYQQLTFRRGTIHSARFAPNSREIVYSASWDGETNRLFSTHPNGPESPVPGIDEGNLLAISVTGELALSQDWRFLGNWLSRGTLAKVQQGLQPEPLLTGVLEADWHPDGKQLVIVRREGGWHRLSLFPSQKLLARSELGWFSHPRFSRDGSRVAYIDHPSMGNDEGSVAVVDLTANPKPVKLGVFWASIQGLAWSAAGGEVWFTATDTGSNMALHAITPGGRHRTVARGPGRLRLLDIHTDGRVLLTRDAIRGSALCTEISPDTGQAQVRERELSYLDQSQVHGLSRDGKRVLLVEQAGSNQAGPTVYLRTTDGAPPRELGGLIGACLSEDGNWLVAEKAGQPHRLIVRPIGPGGEAALAVGPIREYAGMADACRGCKWMPDGRAVLFSAAEEGPGVRLYVQPVPRGLPRAFTPEGLDLDQFNFAGAPDGTTVAAVDREHNQVILCPIAGGAPRALPGLTADDLPVQWSSDGRDLFVRQRIGLPLKIDRYRIADGQRTLLREIKPADPAGQLDVNDLALTPDGRFCAYTLFRILSDLYVVEGLK